MVKMERNVPFRMPDDNDSLLPNTISRPGVKQNGIHTQKVYSPYSCGFRMYNHSKGFRCFRPQIGWGARGIEHTKTFGPRRNQGIGSQRMEAFLCRFVATAVLQDTAPTSCSRLPSTFVDLGSTLDPVRTVQLNPIALSTTCCPTYWRFARCAGSPSTVCIRIFAMTFLLVDILSSAITLPYAQLPHGLDLRIYGRVLRY